MDANEITCPKCGHLNNYISEGCVKCGIIFSKYFEMQEREQQLDSAGAPQVESKSEATPVTAAVEDSGGEIPEPAAVEGTIEMNAEAVSSEPQVPSAAEAAPVEEEPAQASAEISMAEIEMSAETEAEGLDMPAPSDTESPVIEPEAEDASDALEQITEEVDTPAESPAGEAQADKQISEIKNEEAPQTADAPVDKSPEPEESDDASPAEEVFELVEPLGKEKDNVIPLKAEPKPEKPELSIAPDLSAEKKEGPTPVQIDSEPAVETAAEPAAAVDTPPSEEEAEILLEEIAEPVKADAAATKAEDRNRIELLKKQKAALAKAAAAKKQKLVQAKKIEALKKQKAAQAKVEALKRQKAAALKKQKLQAQAQAIKQQKAAQAEAETLTQETQTMVNQPSEIQQPLMAQSVASNLKIMGLLKKYEGKTIGINYDNSADIKAAELVEANDEFFSVMVAETKLQYSYPLQTLLSLIEGEDGVQPEESESKTKYSAVIKVYPLVLF
jgi:hypothetical protein